MKLENTLTDLVISMIRHSGNNIFDLKLSGLVQEANRDELDALMFAFPVKFMHYDRMATEDKAKQPELLP